MKNLKTLSICASFLIVFSTTAFSVLSDIPNCYRSAEFADLDSCACDADQESGIGSVSPEAKKLEELVQKFLQAKKPTAIRRAAVNTARILAKYVLAVGGYFVADLL